MTRTADCELGIAARNQKCAERHALLLAFTVLLLVGLPTAVMACPGCKEALFDPGQLQQKLSTAKGYALSIGLLLAVPFGLVAGLTTLIIRAHHRKKPV